MEFLIRSTLQLQLAAARLIKCILKVMYVRERETETV